jgi:uncharacterized protein
MKCPVCADVNLVMSERQGIEIDYCPQCRGVWLDRGELDKIVGRSAGQPAQGPHGGQPQGYPSSHGHGGHSHGKPYRKKSFLEELFD